MKRFHVHAHVDDLPASIAFYTKMFGAEPARVETDYAKWMIEDPRINFAISTRGAKPGVDHLGLQTDTEAELAELKDRARADGASLAQQAVDPSPGFAFSVKSGMLSSVRKCSHAIPCGSVTQCFWLRA